MGRTWVKTTVDQVKVGDVIRLYRYVDQPDKPDRGTVESIKEDFRSGDLIRQTMYTSAGAVSGFTADPVEILRPAITPKSWVTSWATDPEISTES